MAETTGYMTPAYTQDEETDDPEVIRARIEQTRANMSRTVNSIQEKLAPERLAQQAKDSLREATSRKVDEMAETARRKANHWRSSLSETIRQNPVPAAMVGIGLGWLLMKGSNSEASRKEYHYYPDSEGNYRLYSAEEWNGPYYEEQAGSRVGNAAHAVQERAGEMAESARSAADSVMETASSAAEGVAESARSAASTVADTARSAANTVADTASSAVQTVAETARSVQHTTREQAQYLANQAKAQARYAKTEFEYLRETNPLALGVVAVAAGAIIGLMLPRTQAEDRLMGASRDRLMEQAKNTAKETLNKVQHVAEESYQAAKEEAERQELPMMAGDESGRRDLPVAE